MARTQWMQGRFLPANKSKYMGDLNKLFYRSSWERYMMNWLDNTPEILKWSSETIVINYLDQGTPDPITGLPKQRRYYVDFVAVIKKPDGTSKVTLMEIKPKSQTKPPRKTARTSDKTYLAALKTWKTNSSKWEATKKYCQEKGWEFIVISEDILFAGLDKGYKKPKKKVAKK